MFKNTTKIKTKMADKGGKRRAFNVPPISDLDEVLEEVTPVFRRLKKANKKPKSTMDCAESTTTTNFAKEQVSLDGECREPKGPKPSQQLGCLISDESSETLSCETVVKPMCDEQTEEEIGKKGGKVHVGRNFMETFAFIEKTKHYEEPKASKVSSSSSLEDV